MHKRHRKGSRTTRHSRAFQTKRTVSLMMPSWIPVACCAHLDLEFLRSGLMLSHGHSVQYTGSLLVTPRFGYIMCGRPKALSRFPDRVQDLAVELFVVCCLHMLITSRPRVSWIKPCSQQRPAIHTSDPLEARGPYAAGQSYYLHSCIALPATVRVLCPWARWFVVVRGGSWWFVVVRGGSWWVVVGRGVSWWFVVVRGGSRWFVVVRGGSWWFVVVRGGSWWVVVVRGGSWWFVVARGGSSWLVVARGGSWWVVVVRGGSWWFVVVCGGSWWLVVVRGGAWWCVVVRGGS